MNILSPLTFFTPFDSLATSPSTPPYFERDLVAYLKSFALPIYPGHVPQTATLPAMSYFLIRSVRETGIAGSTGQVEALYQIAVGSRSKIDCNTVPAQLRARLQNYRQKLMGQTYVSICLVGPELDQYTEAVDGTDQGVHTRIGEYRFFYRESIPNP